MFRCLFFISLLTLSGCFAPKVIRQEHVLFEELIKGNDQVSRRTLKVGQDELFYAASGDPQKASLIIIHGTPGDWEQYARYLIDQVLLDSFYIIVIDRPGWGKSVLGDKRQIASFSEQAKIISALADELKHNNNNKAVILMGHSLGASIAPKVAMNYPASIDGLLLFAGTLSPELSDPRWFNQVAKMPGINFMIGSMMRKSNQEILALKTEMELMKPLWLSVKAKTLVVQGMQDKLVYPNNIVFAENHLNANVTEAIRLEQDGHLFPMTRRDDVANWAICLLNKINTGMGSCS